MNAVSSWDFRDGQELAISQEYNNKGYIIEDANLVYLDSIKASIEKAFFSYFDEKGGVIPSLEGAHHSVKHHESNDLRLHIMNTVFRDISFLKDYYNSAKNVIHALCGNELAIQKRPGLSINLPENVNDVLPIHSDTWNGVSPYELNIWIPLVNCTDSMCLYILKRENYIKRINESKDLLRLSSDELFNELKNDLTSIPIRYGQILAFDQSLPHGYALNQELDTHWSINCRFKGLHTPYWDKKLGEYFMPITVKNCTRMGMQYVHPEGWV